MKYAYNKKKINFNIFKNYLKYFIFIFFLFCLLFFIYNEFKNRGSVQNLIQGFSDKFDYNYKNYKINILKRVDIVKISEQMNQYYDQSIFLLPLNIISANLHSIKWVKSVNLTINLIPHMIYSTNHITLRSI